MYHFSVKVVSRSRGRSATAAAAYRAGQKIVDRRTGVIHDYTKKSGVIHTELLVPAGAPNWATNRDLLWNAVEEKETRRNATVAREFEVAIPVELNALQRRAFVVEFAREIVAHHGCAVDVCLHAPRGGLGEKNYHAHILCSTRRLSQEGFTEKTRELDMRRSGEIARWRERFAEIQNEHLRRAGCAKRVDHRSLLAQGILRSPARHLGPAAANFERRTGRISRRNYQSSEEKIWMNRRLDLAAEKAVPRDLINEIDRTRKNLEELREKYNRGDEKNSTGIVSLFEKKLAYQIVPNGAQSSIMSADQSSDFESAFERYCDEASPGDEFEDDERENVPRF